MSACAQRVNPYGGAGGDVTRPGFIEFAAKLGYDGFVCPRIFGQRLANVAPEDGARLGLESIRAITSAARILLADADY